MLPVQGAQAQSLVRKLDSQMPQLKVPYATSKTWYSKKKKKKKKRSKEGTMTVIGSKSE